MQSGNTNPALTNEVVRILQELKELYKFFIYKLIKMPRIGRQFVTINEFNKLEQRVKRIEDNLGIQQTQSRAIIDDDISEEEERDKRIINLYVEPELITSNVISFDKNWIPKNPDLSYAGNKTFLYIRIHQVITKPKKINTSAFSEFGEYVNTTEFVLPYFSIFLHTLGSKDFSIKEITIKKYLLYNIKNSSETISFDYRHEISQLRETNDEPNGNITFIINHKMITEYDTEKFINLINIRSR